jgi:type IV secretory pathway VirB2 component (pilin)
MKNITKSLAVVSLSSILLQAETKAAGIESGQPIVFDSLDKLLWSIILTVQYYTLPIMAIALVLLGIKLLTSSDDTNTKEIVKNWMIKILIGGVIIFGAATIATIIKSNVGGI